MQISFDVTEKQYNEMTAIAQMLGFEGLQSWFESIFQTQYNNYRTQRIAFEANRGAVKLLNLIGATSEIETKEAENILPFLPRNAENPPIAGENEFKKDLKKEAFIDELLRRQKEKNDEKPDNAS